MTQAIVDIRPHESDLLAQIATVHIAEIPDGFLTSLGPAVLTDMYKTIAESEGSFIVACVTDDREILGFLAGSLGIRSLYREFLRLRGMRSMIRLGFALLSPSRMGRILETLRYSTSDEDAKNLPRAEILNFCVARHGHRQGLGGQLMHASQDRFRSANIDRIRIVTGQSQLSAQSFYKKIGANYVCDVEIHSGTPSTMFTWEIPAEESHPEPQRQSLSLDQTRDTEGQS